MLHTPPVEPTFKQPIIDAVDPAILRREFAALPKCQTLSESGRFVVVYADGGQIPHTLREIGRLREIAFRKVHEGTGQPLDLDRFDADYLQLFVWNCETNEVIGGYRLGQTDVILDRRGMDGLYTSTLFDYQFPLLQQISPALELGRSFVRPEYQRSFSPLMMLWKGIGLYACRNPRYARLFGPVSINSQYNSVSKQLIMSFLRAQEFLADLAHLIHPRNAPLCPAEPQRDYPLGTGATVARDLDEVDTLVRQIESDQKGIPILLKQYMKLGGKLLGFNVDPAFGNVLDGLMLVDLTQTNRRILDRYMGRENASAFLSQQRLAHDHCG